MGRQMICTLLILNRCVLEAYKLNTEKQGTFADIEDRGVISVVVGFEIVDQDVCFTKLSTELHVQQINGVSSCP